MGSVIIGVLAGLYAGNPKIRATVDMQLKRAVGIGVDYLNGKGAVIDPPQEVIEGD